MTPENEPHVKMGKGGNLSAVDLKLSRLIRTKTLLFQNVNLQHVNHFYFYPTDSCDSAVFSSKC